MPSARRGAHADAAAHTAWWHRRAGHDPSGRRCQGAAPTASHGKQHAQRPNIYQRSQGHRRGQRPATATAALALASDRRRQTGVRRVGVGRGWHKCDLGSMLLWFRTHAKVATRLSRAEMGKIARACASTRRARESGAPGRARAGQDRAGRGCTQCIFNLTGDRMHHRWV